MKNKNPKKKKNNKNNNQEEEEQEDNDSDIVPRTKNPVFIIMQQKKPHDPDPTPICEGRFVGKTQNGVKVFMVDKAYWSLSTFDDEVDGMSGARFKSGHTARKVLRDVTGQSANAEKQEKNIHAYGSDDDYDEDEEEDDFPEWEDFDEEYEEEIEEEEEDEDECEMLLKMK